MEGEGLGEDVAAGLVGHGGEAGFLFRGDIGEAVLGALEFGEAGVDLEFDCLAEGVLLGDEGLGLIGFDLALQGGDAFVFEPVGGFDFGEAELEGGDGGLLGFADLSLEGGFFGSEVFEEGAESF